MMIKDFFKAKPKFSIIVIAFNMKRELSRTLKSLERGYQWGIGHLDYEVIVVDNGSSPRLEEQDVISHGEQFKLLTIKNAPPSPAKAMNIGAREAIGQYLCMMVDGAHILTPGILHFADLATRIYKNPIITPHYFFTGPGQQSVTIKNGYNQQVEDQLFNRISWPSDGYKLFEIGEIIGEGRQSWFMEKFECNCLFVNRKDFFKHGEVNERFELPGGGLVNLDLYKRMVEGTKTTVVGIIGEGTFHQVHGGDTTNSNGSERAMKISKYRSEYYEIYKRPYSRPKVNIQYIGHMPNLAAMYDVIKH